MDFIKYMKILFSKIYEIIRQIIYYPRIVLDDIDYDMYWKAKKKNLGIPNNWQKQRGKWIVERIEPNSTVLDIGCGDGAVLLYMLQQKEFTAIGADISDYVLNFLNSKKIKTIKVDINNLKDIENLPEVDYILLLEVLEHIPNSEKFLKTILKKAKKGVFFSVPNSGYISYRLRLLFGSFPVQWKIHPGEHLRFWTYKDIKWWLKQLNLYHKSEIYVYEGIPFLNKIWKNLFGAGILVYIKK
ncbi:MAG TPA: methyltransferase domain-containing protein [Candidatus Nanopusillus sp.]|nr:methyltransferase domain-containing protein [Candidatus Nanopusillus sp.]